MPLGKGAGRRVDGEDRGIRGLPAPFSRTFVIVEARVGFRFSRLLSAAISVATLAVVLSAGACNSPTTPTPPPPPIPDPPQISCPTVPAQTSPNGQAMAVSFTPSVILGAAPVTTTCTPASGTLFTVGSTAVSCSAVDARQRSASCSFTVVVQPPPRIALTRFLAFGDSITWGEDGTTTLTFSLNKALSLDYPGIRLVGREYPTVVQQLLQTRYATQILTVDNQGERGEYARDATTLTRFRNLVFSGRYDVVLLMEGTNDIWNGFTGGDTTGIAPAITALRQMIRDARSRGVRVFLATIGPGNPAGLRGLQRYQAIPPLNAEIRLLATSEGVPLVDVFQAYNNNFAYLSADGIHPNAEGFALIATTFYDAIRRELEVRTLTPTMSTLPSEESRAFRPAEFVR